MYIFRLSTARIKIRQIPHVIFQTKSQFFFKVWITLQCHEKSFFCTFLAETLYAIDKSSTSKCKFSDFPLLALKFTKFLMSFLEARVSQPFFTVMIDRYILAIQQIVSHEEQLWFSFWFVAIFWTELPQKRWHHDHNNRKWLTQPQSHFH